MGSHLSTAHEYVTPLVSSAQEYVTPFVAEFMPYTGVVGSAASTLGSIMGNKTDFDMLVEEVNILDKSFEIGKSLVNNMLKETSNYGISVCSVDTFNLLYANYLKKRDMVMNLLNKKRSVVKYSQQMISPAWYRSIVRDYTNTLGTVLTLLQSQYDMIREGMILVHDTQGKIEHQNVIKLLREKVRCSTQGSDGDGIDGSGIDGSVGQRNKKIRV